MNHLFSKTIIAACILAGSAGLANAAAVGTPGPVDTKTADVIFTAPSAVTLKLTPTEHMASGATADATVVAKADISTNAGVPATYVMRMTPTVGTIDPVKSWVVTYSGTNDHADHLVVGLKTSAGRDMGNGWQLIDATTTAPSPTSWQNIITYGAQTIKPDTYVISVDGAVWNK